ncbi:MAG TPA: hypothetical protein VHN15_11110 [Thermoanaerobaculia bacterium]|nr:hypothetical protein [Thermoanaerobaculia bacterium]
MAQRSVQAAFNNQTSQTLQNVSSNLAHGIWGIAPPPTIPANQTVNWESESNGFMTGVQGDAIYSVQGQSSILTTLNWDNPFAGSSSYFGNVNNSAYTLTTTIVQDGNNASILYTLTSS